MFGKSAATAPIGIGSRALRCVLGLAALTFFFALQGMPANAMKIQEITSPGGIKAWLVEEHSVPLIAMDFAFLGGASQDPAKMPGVAHFLTAMLDEGAGDLTAEAFQQRTEELAIRMEFDAGRDSFIGSFQTLTENRDEASDMLALALNKPRFDADAIERMRQQIAAGINFDAQDPDKVAGEVWFRLAFPDHPYARPVNGTMESVTAISATDLEAYRSRVFARDNLKISVVGDIDATQLGVLLDKVFGALPENSSLTEVGKATASAGPIEKVVEMNVPQSVARFGHQAVDRHDPDFIPLYVLNYVLGGGGFSSRLTEEVREKRGLAYSVFTYVAAYDHASIFLGGVATKNEGVNESMRVIRSELARMATDGPTVEELEGAKQYLTGSYALRFDTSSKISSQLLGILIEDLGIDYVDKRNGLIDAIRIEDVKRVAQRVLKPENLILTIVGRPQSG